MKQENRPRASFAAGGAFKMIVVEIYFIFVVLAMAWVAASFPIFTSTRDSYRYFMKKAGTARPRARRPPGRNPRR